MSDDDCEDEAIEEGGLPIVLIMGVCSVLALVAFLIAYVLNNLPGGAGGDASRPPPGVLRVDSSPTSPANKLDSSPTSPGLKLDSSPKSPVLKRCCCRRCRLALEKKPPPSTIQQAANQEGGEASANASGSNQEVVQEPSEADHVQEDDVPAEGEGEGEEVIAEDVED